MLEVTPVINAAGKLTALGGSAQSQAVADAQAEAARKHVDLAGLRRAAGLRIAEYTGAEAACVTTGAAAGNTNAVPETLLADTLAREAFAGFMYIQSHHSVQDNMIPLDRCIALCREHRIPVIVDAAAEEDLGKYIEMGVDLVTCSGGKAFGGPTVGFIAGKAAYIAACELSLGDVEVILGRLREFR